MAGHEIRYIRDRATSGGTGYDFITSQLDGPARLRVINANNLDHQIQMTIELVRRGSPDSSIDSIALAHKEMSRGAGYDVGWEGDIEIDANMKVRCTYDASTAGDTLVLTVGYERA